MSRISIGLPVFNGEKFLEKRIKNILEQKFTDFELIISNNGSIDCSDQICRFFAEQDKRIIYFNQNNNQGAIWNFNFVLNKAKSEYFVWAGVDDIWNEDFISETLNFLEHNNEFVGCISNVESYDSDPEIKSTNLKIFQIFKKIRVGRYGVEDAAGKYEKKIKIYLKRNSAQAIYGVYKTDAIRKSFINQSFLGVDLAIILNILKFGDFHVIEKNLIKFYMKGFSSQGIRASTRKLGHSLFGKIFPYYPFTKWFFQKFGYIIFIKNFTHFIKLNLVGELAIIYDIFLSNRN